MYPFKKGFYKKKINFNENKKLSTLRSVKFSMRTYSWKYRKYNFDEFGDKFAVVATFWFASKVINLALKKFSDMNFYTFTFCK